VTTLRGITWDHPRGLDPMRATATRFAEEHTGMRIDWVARSLQAFGEESIEELAREYDLLVIDHPFVGTAARSGCLLQLDSYLPSAFLAAQERESVGPSHRSYAYDGHQWALAIDAAAQVSAYRPDLLAMADRSVPLSWAEVFELADLAGRARVAMPLNPVNVICSFLTLCANHGEPPGREETRLVGRATGRIALDILRRLIERLHPESLDFTPPRLLDRMSTTNDIVYCPLLFGYSNYARRGYAPYLCRFANIPSVAGSGLYGALLGGAGLAISSRCQAVSAACAYAQWVASPDCQRTVYVASGGQPANRLAWTDPAVNAATSDFFDDTLETLDHAYVRPRHDGYIQGHDISGLVLHDYLRNGGSERSTLDRLDALYVGSRLAASVARP